MKEEEGSRYLSALVKQDLAKFDTDGDTRRAAIKSLKLLVEQLDSSTLPRFISQIADSREREGTRCFSISLYEDVARVHGKLVIPQILKIMNSLVRSSCASGSSPQLQLSSARVTAALARYAIDSNTAQGEAEMILQEICAPLTDALAGKLEPVATNAATCIHALVETEQWGYAHEETVHEICQRTIVALNEKLTRTAAHMQLACVLASTNPYTLSIYGASLLRACEDILKATSNSWQLRKAAAKLLQSVLTILDKETLETELHSALNALDNCRLDKMPHVRAAVTEALHTAKMLASRSTIGESPGTTASPLPKSAERNNRSPWSGDEFRGSSPRNSVNAKSDSISLFPKRGTSPKAPMSPIKAGNNSTRVGSPNMRAASPTSQQSSGFSNSLASTSASDSAQILSARSNERSKAKRAPVYPRYSPQSSGTPCSSPSSSTTTVEDCKSPSWRLITAKDSGRSRSQGTKVNSLNLEEDEARHTKKYLRRRASLPTGALTGLLPTELDSSGVNVQKRSSIQDSKNANNRVRLDGFEDARQARRILPRLKLGDITSQTRSSSNDGARIERENRHDNFDADMEEEKREIFTSSILIRAQSSPSTALIVHNGESKEGDRLLHGQSIPRAPRYNSFSHELALELEKEITKSTTMTKDMLPCIPPARLVRSLSSLSNPETSRASLFEQGEEFFQDDVVRPINADTTEFDAETSSDAGWSVRDNPMASEELYFPDSLDEDMDHQSNGEDFPRLRKVVSVDSSPREIHMITPEYNRRWTIDDPSGRTRNPEMADDAFHLYANGVSNLLHNDEMIRANVCFSCACQHSDSIAPGQYQDATEESGRPSAKEVQNQNDQGPLQCSPFRVVSLHWRTLRWCARAALGGSLFLILAVVASVTVPVIFVSRALGRRREYDNLVPT